MNYSQNQEQRYILEACSALSAHNVVGTFLDIGAADGKTFSNTRKLAELGFEGVCIEPSPKMFVQLMDLYKDNPKVKTVFGAVSDANRLASFEACADFVSTFNTTESQRRDTAMWSNTGVVFQPIYVPTITVKDIFETFGNSYHVISIDTEGHDLIILDALISANELKGTNCVCVEYRPETRNEIHGRLARLGFNEVYCSGENLVMSR